MKKALILACLFLVSHRVSAALPFIDPFADATANGGTAYHVGDSLTNQSTAGNLWQAINSAAGAPQPTIVAGNLSYPNLAATTGNSVMIVPASAVGARLNLNATVTSGRAYYSFILKITNIDAVPTVPANNWFSGFGDGVGGQTSPVLRQGAKILTQKSGAGYVFGVGKTTNETTYVYDSTVHSVDEVVFVVAAWEQIAGDSTNALLWINPSSDTFGATDAPAPTLSISTVGSGPQGVLNTSGVKSFILSCQNSNAPTAIIDEVRVATEWKYVTGGDPAILQNPTNRTVAIGGNASFSVTARGTPTLTYQWFKDGSTPLSDGGSISGATTPTLSLSGISAGDVGAYSVTVTGGLGDSVQSSSAMLSLNDPSITSQPQSRTNDFNTTATFTVVASGTGPFSYQWHKEGVGNLTDGGNISGSQSSTLTLTGVSFPDGGNYSVTVSNSLAAVESATAALIVKDPVVITQPTSITNPAGDTVTFHVVADGTPPLSYQWRKGANYIFDVGNVSGTSTDTLTISNITSADGGNYSVAVIGGYSSIEYSDNATLTVLSPAEIALQPVSRTVAVGASVSFAVGAIGSEPFSYQWLLNGTNLPGATAISYSLTDAQISGNYTVIVSNSVNSVTSAPAVLTVSTNLQLYETNVVVVRVGDAAQALTVNGNSIFLDQFDTSGSYVNTMNIPDEGPTGMVAIGWDNISGVNSGSTTGTSLTRSLDGRFMVVAGYNTNRNYGASLNNSLAADVPRGIGLVNSHAQYLLPVASTDPVFDQTYWRAGVTDGTNNFWGIGGIAGTYYFGFDAPPVLVQNTFINSRSMGLFNGDIYCATAASFTGQTAKGGLLKLDGMPTNSVTPTIVVSNATGVSSGAYDMTVSPNGNLIYLADQRSLAGGGGIQRYDFDGSNWALTYTLNSGFGNLGPRYITADFSGANPIIYVTSNDQSFDNNRIIKFEDTGAGSAGTTIAYAGMNQTFRGIHFGPIASSAIVTQPVLTVARDGNNVVLSWSGAFILQSSTNVAGPYLDVPSATSPHTNDVSTSEQLFFRLHQ